MRDNFSILTVAFSQRPQICNLEKETFQDLRSPIFPLLSYVRLFSLLFAASFKSFSVGGTNAKLEISAPIVTSQMVDFEKILFLHTLSDRWGN